MVPYNPVQINALYKIARFVIRTAYREVDWNISLYDLPICLPAVFRYTFGYDVCGYGQKYDDYYHQNPPRKGAVWNMKKNVIKLMICVTSLIQSATQTISITKRSWLRRCMCDMCDTEWWNGRMSKHIHHDLHLILSHGFNYWRA